MKFQIINSFNDDLSLDYESTIDQILQEYDLGITDPYLDGPFSKNILENAKIMGYFIDDTRTTTIHYTDCSRSSTEVKGGYKIALKRGAKLNEVTVFNFPPLRLKNQKIDSITHSPLAQIYPYENERWILLHPVDTEMIIDYEKTSYSEIIKKYVHNGKVTKDVYEDLLANLKLLNINERCAQTLIHEYGHILHWRQFDLMFEEFSKQLGVSAKGYSQAYNALILSWFEESNYLYNVSSRHPYFKNKSISEKVNILKESFVEDYRIGLNIDATNGKILLPNSQCILGDVMEPELMREGVAIVKQMIRAIEKRPSFNNVRSTENEYDRIESLVKLDKQVENTNWKPTTNSLTRFEGKNLIEEALKETNFDCFEEAAATTTLK